MKNTIPLTLLFLFFISCTSSLVNYSLKKMGVYDEEIKLQHISNNQKSIVFFPMAHLSTFQFYDDVKQKIDSLHKIGYVFYYEGVKKDSLITNNDLRKTRKLTGIGLSVMADYKTMIDSVFKGKVKLKKKLIAQNDVDLGLNNDFNIDASLKGIISYYESKYGEIVLDSCDFNTGLVENYECENEIKNADDAIIDFRNHIIIQNILDSTHIQKLALVYGKSHTNAIKDSLIKLGYKEID